MNRRFLAIGECMVELADAGGGMFRRGFAGDTFNAAWYARRRLPAEWEVGYCTCVGDDAVSAEMLAFMEREGVAAAGSARRHPSRSVGLYMISLDGGERSFSYWRDRSAARTLAEDPQWLEDTVAGGDVLYFSAITMAILPPEGRRTLWAALARARAAGATVAFDTNLRPALWESPEAMREGVLLGASVADVALPSLDDERALFGVSDAGAAAARYAELGAEVVAVKDGAGALTLQDGRGVRVLEPAAVERVVDTTAAGDSFGGTFVAGLALGLEADDAAREAMEMAARVVGALGALVRETDAGEPK